MSELKPCPFCGGADVVDIAKPVNDEGDMESFVECYTCGAMVAHSSLAGLHLQIWNTRAAPTMKQWEWVEGDGASVVWACLDFKAYVYSDCGMWRAYVDCRSVGSFAVPEAGRAACVAYVEGKLKEWLV
jgi:Lar family restriction alleviation protein